MQGYNFALAAAKDGNGWFASPGMSNVGGNDDISMNIPRFHKIPTPPQILSTDTRSRKNYKSLVPPKLKLETPAKKCPTAVSGGAITV